MGLKNFSKNTVTRVANIWHWTDYVSLKESMRTFASAIKSRFTPVPMRHEVTYASFENLLVGLKLNDSELLKRQYYFERLAKIYLSVWVVGLLYGFYLVYKRAWLGVASTIVLSIMILCQAFQYHFWAFQIKQRRCDCTFWEWLHCVIPIGWMG